MIRGFLKELVKKKDKIVAGISGGADSVCLLLNLCELKKEMDFKLFCIYIDHGIRGRESEQDGKFVEDLCRKLSVDFKLIKVDVPGAAAGRKKSEEEVARDLRYEALLKAAEDLGYKTIAVAHNANDNAETFLFRLIRGTGTAGLTGMDEITERGNITIIRPLLYVGRSSIEEYLKEKGQAFVMDSTNLSDKYTRNRIRHRIIPELEEINPKAVEHINAAAASLREMYRAEESAERLYEEASGGRELSIEHLKDHSPSLVRSVIRLWIRDTGVARDVGRVHYEAIEKLINSDTGHSVDLPGGQSVERVYDRLRLNGNRAKRIPGKAASGSSEVDDVTEIRALSPGEKVEISIDGMYLSLRLYSGQEASEKKKELSFQKNYAKYYDYGKIDKNMVLRHRRDGDYLVINPDGTKKPLGRYFVDEKISRDERDEAWLLCTDSKVILAPGYRGSEDARVEAGTTEILEVEFWRT